MLLAVLAVAHASGFGPVVYNYPGFYGYRSFGPYFNNFGRFYGGLYDGYYRGLGYGGYFPGYGFGDYFLGKKWADNPVSFVLWIWNILCNLFLKNNSYFNMYFSYW